MKTKLERIAEKSVNKPKETFTSLYHLINEEMLLQCHKELDGNKAVGIDRVSKEEFGRELESSKSRLLEFGRYAEERRKARGEGKPETFDYLGFTFYCGKSREGKFCVMPKTSRKKFKQKVKSMKEWLRSQLTAPVKNVMETINRKLTGHYRYYGVTHNGDMLKKFHYIATNLLLKMMNRRSEKKSYTWEGFRMMLKHYPLAQPKIYYSLYT